MSRTKQILVLNTFIDDKLALSFDQAIARPIDTLSLLMKSLRIPNLTGTPDLSPFSHAVISGSEATAYEDLVWFPLLEAIIQTLIQKKVPILAICFGHQFLARTLANKGYVRRSSTPEFGWLNLQLKDNALFKGVERITSMVSHYDEAVNLPEDFKILASSPGCPVHAFQFKNLPVWGVQFHPEYNLQEAGEIFDRVINDDARFPDYFVNQLQNIRDFQPNKKIILNFLQTK